VIPDDAADRPLTPGERAVIADLERRLLLDSPTPRRMRGRATGFRTSAAVPLVALLGTASVLVAVAAVAGAGVLGMTAVLASVVATALLWPRVPASLGGPMGSAARRPYRMPKRIAGR
jgi:hypothetical protein